MTLVFNKTLQCIFFTIKGSATKKKKFENLRARYSQEKQRIKKAKKSGTSSDEVLSAQKEASDTFPYLHFLDQHISPRATKSNLVERREESDHEDNGDGDDENDDSYMETSSTASAVEVTESESTSPKAGSSKDHVSDSLASKQKQPKQVNTRKSKQTTTKVDMELEVMKVVGEGLKTMCSSMQQQPVAAKEEKDEDDLFGFFVASQLKCMDHSKKARAKYHINNMIFQVMMSGPSGDGPSGFMQDLNSGQGFYLG